VETEGEKEIHEGKTNEEIWEDDKLLDSLCLEAGIQDIQLYTALKVVILDDAMVVDADDLRHYEKLEKWVPKNNNSFWKASETFEKRQARLVAQQKFTKNTGKPKVAVSRNKGASSSSSLASSTPAAIAKRGASSSSSSSSSIGTHSSVASSLSSGSSAKSVSSSAAKQLPFLDDDDEDMKRIEMVHKQDMESLVKRRDQEIEQLIVKRKREREEADSKKAKRDKFLLEQSLAYDLQEAKAHNAGEEAAAEFQMGPSPNPIVPPSPTPTDLTGDGVQSKKGKAGKKQTGV
jgi:hypothetical protein